MTNRNKYNLRDARMAKRNNSARLATYADIKKEISKNYKEFVAGCKWIDAESRKPEHMNKFMLYERVIGDVLTEDRLEWNTLFNSLETASNGKFRRDLRHTWNQLGDAVRIIYVYESRDAMDRIWSEYNAEIAECGSEVNEDYIWKGSYEEEYEMEQNRFYGILDSWRK